MQSKNQFSFLKGYTFSFEDDGQSVDAWFSAFSGLEKVFINGKLVSSQRNFSKHSRNNFSIGTNQYHTSLDVTSLFKGPFTCTLFKNDQEIKKQRLVFPRKTGKSKYSFFIILAICFMVGAGFGVVKNNFNLPGWSTYLFLIVVFIYVFKDCLRKGRYEKPRIEED